MRHPLQNLQHREGLTVVELNNSAYLHRRKAPESEQGTLAEYGPSRPEAEQSYAAFHTPVYLRGYSRKILHDLIKVARLYAGRRLRLFRPGEGSRCSRCTNTLTGEVLDSRCPECGGTGRVGSWAPLGDFWSFIDFGPTWRLGTESGNADNPGGVKDQFIVLGAPLLRDQDLLAVLETREVFKIWDAEPHIVALRGDVVAQIAACSRLGRGNAEYRLVDW